MKINKIKLFLPFYGIFYIINIGLKYSFFVKLNLTNLDILLFLIIQLISYYSIIVGLFLI